MTSDSVGPEAAVVVPSACSALDARIIIEDPRGQLVDRWALSDVEAGLGPPTALAAVARPGYYNYRHRTPPPIGYAQRQVGPGSPGELRLRHQTAG